jgi:transcriptional regulator with XRE-family HTH domain
VGDEWRASRLAAFAARPSSEAIVSRGEQRSASQDFRELRLRAGVSQGAVAIAIGVDRSVITRLEQADPSVSPAIRSRACAVLGADFRMQLYHERGALTTTPRTPVSSNVSSA